MKDNIYGKALQEVYVIINNIEPELYNKIPKKLIYFIENNRYKDFKTNISLDIPIDKQELLTETENILSLIYRTYFATPEEKIEFQNIDSKNFN